ncbi:hypothetical protein SLEP1_g10087 [Rubroshorea leprosula]|uniref:Uncharacterized protein n=1 Tax=Rubroshorea leprosula TaxID=152421 RepID=A0AAV5I706_9ROSI|nr:hypothetical protein SLEP1_g10087 [Rubroshorea leprosula]
MQEVSSKLHQITVDDGLDLKSMHEGGVIHTSPNCH